MKMKPDEDEAVGKVADRLTRDYRGEYSPDAVRAAVTTARDHFCGAPVRDFIPVLVERRARESLDHRHAACLLPGRRAAD